MKISVRMSRMLILMINYKEGLRVPERKLNDKQYDRDLEESEANKRLR